MQHVRQHLDTGLQPVVRDLVPVAGHLLRGVGVQHPAGALDRFSHLDSGRALWRALEHHVFQEMREPLRPLFLTA